MLMETAASERDIQGHHHGSKDDTNNNKADNSNSNSSGDGGGGDDDDRRRAAATSRLVRGMYGNLHVSLVATTAELGRLSAEVNRRFIVPVGLVWACLFVDHALQFSSMLADISRDDDDDDDDDDDEDDGSMSLIGSKRNTGRALIILAFILVTDLAHIAVVLVPPMVVNSSW